MGQAISPVLLRNRGVPVTVAVRATDPSDPSRTVPVFRDGTNGDSEPMTEQRWVRVTNNVLVDIEETWGNFVTFAEVASTRPAGTIRKFLSLVWEEDPRMTGDRMLPGRLDEYAAACAAAIMVAQGVDPTVAAKMLETGIKVTSVQTAAATQEAEKMLAEVEAGLDKVAASTGQAGGPSGSDSGSTPTPSGG